MAVGAGLRHKTHLFKIDMLGREDPHSTFSAVEMAHNFFLLFPIHEVEELACLQKYARDYYHSFLGG